MSGLLKYREKKVNTLTLLKVKDTTKVCSLPFELSEIKKGFGGKWS